MSTQFNEEEISQFDWTGGGAVHLDKEMAGMRLER